METYVKDSGFSTTHHNRANQPSTLNTPEDDIQTVHPGVSQQDAPNRIRAADGRLVGVKKDKA